MGEISAGQKLREDYAGGKRSFRNADLRGADLSQANLSDIDLQGAYLRWADLQGARLDRANLTWADLQRANLSNAILYKALLEEANLRKANLQWADLQEAELKGAALIGSNLACSNLRRASMRLANLQGANLDQAKLPEADLRVATLVGAKLLDADLQNAKLQEVNSIGANLTGANMQGANMQGASFQEAKLSGANLQGASLQGASLQKADLQEAKLFGANLTGANLMGARLPSLQNMQSCQLTGAQLQGIKLPRGENLEAAILPDGSIPIFGQPSPETEPSSPDTLAGSAESIPEEQLARGNTETESPILGENNDSIGASLHSWKDKTAGANGSMPGGHTARSPLLPLLAAGQRLDPDGRFRTSSITIAHRRGPARLRQNLLAAYNGQCAITSCDAEPVLEATLLIPNYLRQDFDVSDGLLLRADIHTLFDLYLIAIEPDTMKILIAPSLRDTSYGELHSEPLRPPIADRFRPNSKALQWHWNWCQWDN